METKDEGITLIALVITIIVLLILAGVSISLVVGNNGVLTQATNAKEETQKATALEMVELEVAGSYGLDGKIDLDHLKTNLMRINGIKYNSKQITNDTIINEFPVIVNVDGNNIEINENGKVSKVAIGNSAEIAGDSGNIGKAVNYEGDYSSIGTGTGWQILYADSKNVYIITTGYLTATGLWSAESTKYSGTSDFLDLTNFPAVEDGWFNKVYDNGTFLYNSNKPNMKAIEYILDSSVSKWKDLKNDKAKWAIGSPTMELLVASYNAVNTSNKVTIEDLVADGNGYAQTFSGGLTKTDNRPWNHGTDYWLASPSYWSNTNIHAVLTSGECKVISKQYNLNYALRPVICLKSSTVLTWNDSTNKYDLSVAK